MTDITLQLQNELRRLETGPSPGEKPGGVGTVRFDVSTAAGAEEVLRRAKQVLQVIDKAILDGWPSTEGLVPQLPGWFTAACAPPMSREQSDEWLARWRRLPPDEQVKAQNELKWSLDDWLYWMEPANRQWFWWDAEVAGDKKLAKVAIEVEGSPFPWAALRWLLVAAGAFAVEEEE